MDRFSPQELVAMRSTSRSPNKRSGGDDDDGHRAAQLVTTVRYPESADTALVGLATPFKRFRVNVVISPSKSGSALDPLAARRRGFQSLAGDRFLPTVKSVATCAASDGADTECSTHQSSQEVEQKCSPADVAALSGSLLACSETLEDQMDALDVGSFLSWRPPSGERATPPRRHRRKPRIRFGDDDLSLRDVFGDETQLASSEDEQATAADDEAEPEPPVRLAVAHFPISTGCSCADLDCYDALERCWQVFSPPPRLGFDPASCTTDADYGADSDDDAQRSDGLRGA